MSEAAKYIGEWEMIPELSFYETGAAPSCATYRISVRGETVSFSIFWTIGAEQNQVSFEGPLDGRPHALPGLNAAQAIYTHIDDRVLDSSVLVSGQEKNFARRQVSGDGKLMTVLQRQRDENGSDVSTYQVYRRMV